MKLWGAVLVAAAGVWWGILARRQLRQAATCCAELCDMLERLGYELGRFHTPLPTIFAELALSTKEDTERLCRVVADGLLGGDTFSKVWERAIGALPTEERALLRPLGRILGQYAATEQTEAVDAVRRRMEALRLRRAGDLHDRGRIFVGVGSVAGLMLATLLL